MFSILFSAYNNITGRIKPLKYKLKKNKILDRTAKLFKKWINIFFLKMNDHLSIFKMAWSRAFKKCIIYHFFGQFFFANIFTINRIFQKKIQFLQICKF